MYIYIFLSFFLSLSVSLCIHIDIYLHTRQSSIKKLSNPDLGLFIKQSFLDKFNPIDADAWEEFKAGRAAVRRLRGPSGGIDMFVMYLATGEDAADEARASAVRKIAASSENRLSRYRLSWETSIMFPARETRSTSTIAHGQVSKTKRTRVLEISNGKRRLTQSLPAVLPQFSVNVIISGITIAGSTGDGDGWLV